MPRKPTYPEFVIKATNKHNGRYTYLEFNYTAYNCMATIVCKNHGIFQQRCHQHLKGNGCIKCSNIEKFVSVRTTYSQFVEKAIKIHGNKYDYSKFIYLNNKTASELKCNTCDHKWMVRPDMHIHRQNGCPICRVNKVIYTRQYYEAKGIQNHPCYLYVVQFKNESETFIKIGITKYSNIRIRFRGLLKKYDIKVLTLIESNFYSVIDVEQLLLAKYQADKYTPLETFKGYTECLSLNVQQNVLSDLAEMLVSKVL